MDMTTIIAANNVVIASNLANMTELQRYENDPAYRLDVLARSEANIREKMRKDIRRIHNPGCLSCLRDPQRDLGKHKLQLRAIKEEQIAARAKLAEH